MFVAWSHRKFSWVNASTKKLRNSAGNCTVKLISRAKKVQFCERKWYDSGRQLTARALYDTFDLAKVLVEIGFRWASVRARRRVGVPANQYFYFTKINDPTLLSELVASSRPSLS